MEFSIVLKVTAECVYTPKLVVKFPARPNKTFFLNFENLSGLYNPKKNIATFLHFLIEYIFPARSTCHRAMGLHAILAE